MNRNRSTVFIIVMVLCLVIHSGCRRDSEKESPSSGPTSTRTITDMTGRRVTIPVPEDIKRVEELMASQY